MNCGMQCKIVQYRNAIDIDVQFADGTIVKNRTYNSFKNKCIANPNVPSIYKVVDLNKKTTRLGLSAIMNCGMKATIIEYYSASNITVKFDNGEIAARKKWQEFQNKSILPPSASRTRDFSYRIGEVSVMSNGMRATILRYVNSTNIDIIFEDNTIVENVRYADFKSGLIAHPTIVPSNTMSMQEFAIGYYLTQYGFKKSHQGDLKTIGFGSYELDFYNPGHRVAIEVDGDIHEIDKNIERDLIKNQLCDELGITLYRIRAPKLTSLPKHNCHNIMLDKQKKISDKLIDCSEELIELLLDTKICSTKPDIDLRRDYDDILKQYVNRCVDFYAKKHVGEKQISNRACMEMTIIAWRGSHDIDVQFADKAVRTGVTYGSFVAGRVEHPSNLLNNIANQRLGEVRTMNNGLQAKIINYRKSKDIDVQFLIDGQIRHHVDYFCFSKGKIRHYKS